MGYTHYFTVKEAIHEENWNAFVADVTAIIYNSEAGIAGWDGTGSPELGDIIRFNGVREMSHETFYLSNGKDGFNFCKTAFKPYDEVVTAVLIRAKYYFGEALSVGSDGYWSEWQAGRDLYERTFGEVAENPIVREEVIL
jgi:hypothetical protein